MGGARPDLGFRLAVGAGGPNNGDERGDDPVVARPLGPGVRLEVVTLTEDGRRLEPVGDDFAGSSHQVKAGAEILATLGVGAG